MLDPLASGVASVIVPADKLLFCPPPCGCTGTGVSSRVRPVIVTFGPHGLASVEFEEDVTARIAVARSGAGAVVISTTRNRSLVTVAPVLL